MRFSESLLLMAGKQRAFLVAQTIASIGYIVLLFMFCHLFGVLGAALLTRWECWTWRSR